MKPYYSKDGVKIYCGDSRDVLPRLKPVDVVITDPPYEAASHTKQRRLKRNGGISVEPIPFPPITEPDRALVAGLLAKIARRWVLTFCEVEGSQRWRAVYEASGLAYKRTCIWVKPDGMPQLLGDRPGMGYEAFVAMHPPGKSQWNGRGRKGVFTFNKRDPGMGNQRNLHPTQKPLALMECLIGLFSNDRETVLDAYMGSGTTLVAARNLNRRAIGIEIEERYCEIAATRLEKAREAA